ncbi:hypothetical protein ATO8_02180 [Roseivivax marinus]|uniref:Glyceraldehyde-3-phosphate dehydrogenase n=1 Tax=Roseivivax marinus TaxID=1379903 RepID=W4HPI2_9RHOB|nr:hypothetical protein [Roseivivax marinus]ETW14677.1 hypothetical protein ATO8_02180 [Roseivivax marinus]UMA66090.1 hypothetical protein LVO79_06500 [Roseivivax marinus]
MTNAIAIALGLAIVAAAAIDLTIWDGDHLLFLARRAVVFLDWVAFWR